METTRLDASFIQHPYGLYAHLREQGPVHPVVMPNGVQAWIVTRYQEAREALADPRLSKDFRRLAQEAEQPREADRPAGRREQLGAASIDHHMLNTDPPDHTRLRKLVTRAFTARRVERLRPRIEEITAELLDGMAKQHQADLIDAFAFPLPITVICELLGIPPADRDRFRTWSNLVVSSNGAQPEIQEAVAALTAYLVDLIGVKTGQPADDLLSALAQTSNDEDRLSRDELVSMAFLLLIAGHETTVNLIGNGVLALLRNPGQLELVRDDPARVAGAIEEFLRFEGPVNMATFRFTAEPVQLGDVEVPARQLMLVSLNAADHDERRFPDADRLDVTRAPGGHLAFGHGIHYCLGAPLARLEGEVALRNLLERFPGLRLAVPPDQLRWRNSLLMRGLEALPVAWS